MRYFLTLCMMLCMGTTALAQGTFLDRKAEGWHWYEEKPLKESQEKGQKTKTSDPVQHLKAFKAEVEHRKAIAVMDPTFDHVRAYMEIQQQLMNRSTRFAQRWMEVVYQTPALDYTIQHPTSQAGRHVYLDAQKEHLDRSVQKLSQSHGLFFFFSNSCSYCKTFVPIVSAFAARYGWTVMAISMDGSSLPEFPGAVPNNGMAARLGVTFVPTLLAVNPQTQDVIPLSYGLSSHDQILDRIRVLLIERKNL